MFAVACSRVIFSSRGNVEPDGSIVLVFFLVSLVIVDFVFPRSCPTFVAEPRPWRRRRAPPRRTAGRQAALLPLLPLLLALEEPALVHREDDDGQDDEGREDGEQDDEPEGEGGRCRDFASFSDY